MIAGTNINPITDREYLITTADANTILKFGESSDRHSGGFAFQILPDATFIAGGGQLAVCARLRMQRLPNAAMSNVGGKTDSMVLPFYPVQFRASYLNGATSDVTAMQPSGTLIIKPSLIFVPSFAYDIGLQVLTETEGTCAVFSFPFVGPTIP